MSCSLEDFLNLNSCQSKEVVIKKIKRDYGLKQEEAERVYKKWRRDFMQEGFKPLSERRILIKNTEEFIKYYAARNVKNIKEEEIRDISSLLMLGLSVADLTKLKKWNSKDIFRVYAAIRKHDFFKKERRVIYKKGGH